MRIKPEILAHSKGIKVMQSSVNQVTLRQQWLPFYPLPVFGAISGATFLVYIFWIPGSWLDALLMMLGTVFIIYIVAAQCFNSTTLTVTSSGLEWRYDPFPWLPGGMIDKELIKAITFKGSGNRTTHRRRAFSIYSVGVRGSDKWQSNTIFHFMQSAWTAEMTARVIAGYLNDVAVESIP